MGETYFFRDSAQMNALRTAILPEIIEQKRSEGHYTLKFWSAGCSTGEEPYSLAILIRQLLPDLSQWNIIILGTDINQESLDFAARGIYTKNSFRNETPPEIKELYFQPAEKGTFALLPEIRRMVRFAHLNLVSDDYPSPMNFTGGLDLILCRNVTIYFQAETTRQIAERFHRALLPGGWLVVGHSEPMARIYQGFKPRNFKDSVVYQREGMASWRPVETPPVLPAEKLPEPYKPILEPITHLKPPTSTKISAAEYYERGKVCADQMKWEEAHNWLNRALAANPLYIEAHYVRALVYMHEGDHAAALRALERTLYIDRSFVLGHFNIGLIHWKRGNMKAAQRAWRTTHELLSAFSEESVLPHSDGIAAGYVIGLLRTYLNGDGKYV